MLKARKQSAQPDDNSTEAARRRDPDATDFHAIIWINDYPQKARWKVTNKDTMVHVRFSARLTSRSGGPDLAFSHSSSSRLARPSRPRVLSTRRVRSRDRTISPSCTC